MADVPHVGATIMSARSGRMPSFVVRRLGAAETGALRALNAIYADAFDDAPAYAADPPSDGYIADVLAKEQVIVLVASVGTTVIGGLVAYELDKLERARREIYIYDLAVAPSHRRQGVASSLIALVRRIAAERAAWVVYVQADRADAPAVALYRRFGIEEDVLHFDITPAEPSGAKAGKLQRG